VFTLWKQQRELERPLGVGRVLTIGRIMANRVSHQEIVKKVLDSKAVDFTAIGKAVAELGPAMSLADEPWEGFCGTMRTFVHVFIIRGPVGGTAENLAGLRGIAGELKE